MKRVLFLLLGAATLHGCGWISESGVFRSEREAPQATDRLPLSSSAAIQESRPVAPGIDLWRIPDDEPLTLKPTELHPDFGIGDVQFRTDQAGAMAGDKDAALRVAQMFQRGSNSVPRDDRRMVLWLRRASDLNNAAASYQLYLFYVERGLDREAVRFEKRALEQGFTPPPRLDPRRG